MSMKESSFTKEMEIIKTRIMLNKLIQLNLTLHNAIIEYARQNGIPIPISPTILRLTEEIENTDIEVFPKSEPNFSADEFSHEPQNRRRLHRTFFWVILFPG